MTQPPHRPNHPSATPLAKAAPSVCDRLARSYLADVIRRAQRESAADFGTKLQRALRPEPHAATMTSGEVIAALAADDDPFAVSLSAPPPPPGARLIAFQLCCAVRLGTALAAADCTVRALMGPFAVSLLRAPDVETADALYDVLRSVAPKGPEGGAASGLLFGAEPDAPGVEILRGPTDVKDRATFARAFEGALTGRNPMATVVIASGPEVLGADGALLCQRDLSLLRLDAETLLAVLRLTHSATGQIAEDALRAALPDPEALARIAPLPLAVAFRENTTLKVARRLRAIAAAASTAPRLTLDDLHGQPQLKAAAREMVADLRRWRQGALPWAEIPGGLLMSGPPGNGKTHAARVLAGALDAPLIATSYADCQKAGHQGEMLRTLDDRVTEAIGKAPSVFFLDEMDAFSARAGSGAGDRYMRSVVTGLLTQIDRLRAAPGVVLVAATNHVRAVDPALLRSGRFDRHVRVGPPDRQGIAALLAAHLGTTAPEADADPVGRLLGRSGADIASLARQAKARARQDGRPVISADLDAVIREGCPVLDASTLRRVAVHEAGHLLMGHLNGRPEPKRVVLHATGGMVVEDRAPFHTAATARAEIRGLLAGRVAEALCLDAPSSGAGCGPDSDLEQATKLALQLTRQWGLGTDRHLAWEPLPGALPASLRAEINAQLIAAEDAVTRALRPHRAWLERIAQVLIAKRELDRLDVTAMLRATEDPGVRPRDPAPHADA